MPWLVGQVFPKGNYEAAEYGNITAFEQSHDNWIIVAENLPSEQAAEAIVAQKSGTPSGGGGHSGGSSTGGNRADIVAEAINSIGHAYLFGGAPGVNGQDPWDCSSCANDNIGRVNGLSIPGFPNGSYDGTVHGPSTVSWLDWQGSGVGSIDRSQVEGGDLCVWQTHMGIAINNQEMVSAANPTDGTIRSGIDGFISGEQLICLRLANFGPGGITLPNLSLGDTKAIDAITRQIARSSQDLVWKRMQIRNTMTRRF